jgi:ketosteroid isomerase-like protein
MKTSFLIIVLWAPVCIFSQPTSGRSPGSDEVAIREILDLQTKAWNRGDLTAFMQAYWQNDSLMFIGKSGIKWGWEKTLENYKRAYPDTTAMGKLSFEVILVKKLSPEYYYIVGEWRLTRRIGDLSGYYNLLFRKIKGRWLIVADHSS